MKTIYPSKPKDRFEVYRFFNGLSVEAMDFCRLNDYKQAKADGKDTKG